MLLSVKQLIADRGHGGLFSALALFPKKTRFETQDPKEEIILLLRPHIITNLLWVMLSLAALIAPFIWTMFPIVGLLPANYLLILTLLWFALILTFVFEKFLVWFFSVNIVTDERVIDVDFYGLLFKQVDVAQINKIQDINYVQKGIAGAMFNYGDVIIQTASEIPTFNFNNVPNPDRIVKILSELVTEEEREAIEGRVR